MTTALPSYTTSRDLTADSYDSQFMKAGEMPLTLYHGSGSCNSR